MWVTQNFLTLPSIGWQHSCQPIKSYVWKYLLIQYRVIHQILLWRWFPNHTVLKYISQMSIDNNFLVQIKYTFQHITTLLYQTSIYENKWTVIIYISENIVIYNYVSKPQTHACSINVLISPWTTQFNWARQSYCSRGSNPIALSGPVVS